MQCVALPASHRTNWMLWWKFSDSPMRQSCITVKHRAYTTAIYPFTSFLHSLNTHLEKTLTDHRDHSEHLTQPGNFGSVHTPAKTQTEVALPHMHTKIQVVFPFMFIMFKLLSQDTTIITFYTDSGNTPVSLNTSGCDIRAETWCIRIVIGTPCWSLASALMRRSWLFSFEFVRKHAKEKTWTAVHFSSRT